MLVHYIVILILVYCYKQLLITLLLRDRLLQRPTLERKKDVQISRWNKKFEHASRTCWIRCTRRKLNKPANVRETLDDDVEENAIAGQTRQEFSGK